LSDKTAVIILLNTSGDAERVAERPSVRLIGVRVVGRPTSQPRVIITKLKPCVRWPEHGRSDEANQLSVGNRGTRRFYSPSASDEKTKCSGAIQNLFSYDRAVL